MALAVGQSGSPVAFALERELIAIDRAVGVIKRLVSLAPVARKLLKSGTRRLGAISSFKIWLIYAHFSYFHPISTFFTQKQGVKRRVLDLRHECDGILTLETCLEAHSHVLRCALR